MKIYTIEEDKSAEDIRLLLKLNAECARLQWSRSIKDIPADVINALETIEGYVEYKIINICGAEKSALTTEEEDTFLHVIKNNDALKNTLGTGVVIKGKQAYEVASIIENETGMEKIQNAIKSGENVIIF